MIPIHRREAWPQSWGVETTQRREGHGGLRHRWMVVGLVNDSVVDGKRGKLLQPEITATELSGEAQE